MFLFVCKTFISDFIINLQELQGVEMSKKKIVKFTFMIICYIIISAFFIGYFHTVYVMLINMYHYIAKYETRLNFISDSGYINFILVFTVHVVNRHLEIFTLACVLFMATIFICLIQKYQNVIKELGKLIISHENFKAFSDWKKKYKKSVILTTDINEHLKLCILFAVSMQLADVLSVIYYGKVSCNDNWKFAFWTIKYSHPVLAIMIPSVAVNYQVKLDYCYSSFVELAFKQAGWQFSPPRTR